MQTETYGSVLRREFTKQSSRWVVTAEALGNLTGYLYGAYLWFFTDSQLWQVRLVFGLSLCVTALLFYQAARSAWEAEHKKRLDAESVLREHRESAPRLLLREPGAIFVEPNIGFFGDIESPRGVRRVLIFSADFLKIAITNNPKKPSQSAEAKSVLATIEFTQGGRTLKQLDGRWSQSTQPSTRIAKAESTMDLLRMDLGIGDSRTLDVAMKNVDDEDAFMYCNDNYHYPNLKPPQFRLGPGSYQVRIRLRAVGVDETFEFAFKHNGKKSPLEVIHG